MNELLKKLPKIDKFIQKKEFTGFGIESLKKHARSVIEAKREDILSGKCDKLDEDEMIKEVLKLLQNSSQKSLKKLINATGVVVHTNLGRSPIDKSVWEEAGSVVCGYSNLEYNQKEGKRGDRYGHLSCAFSELFGDFKEYDILMVNNNAAAVFLVLNTFAKGKEGIVSRGELVEIGGGFRIPDVMAQSGAKLVEIGTTNKTRIADYEKAITKKSAILMKIHRSNFDIVGFSEEASLKSIAELGKKSGVLSYFDLGSGLVFDLDFRGEEPTLAEVLKDNPDIISFSGDKLLGGVQGGFIVAKRELIEKLKKNQLLRMLRADKVAIALTEAIFLRYVAEKYDEIPTVSMLKIDKKELLEKAKKLQNMIDAKTEIVETHGYTGGGAMPNRKIESIALKIISDKKADDIEEFLRQNDIIARIEDDAVLLDVRTIFEDEFGMVAEAINMLKPSLVHN